MRRSGIVAVVLAILGLAAGTGAVGTILVSGADIDSGDGDVEKGPVVIDPAFPVVAAPNFATPEPRGAMGAITDVLPGFPGAGTGINGVFNSGSGATLTGGTYEFTNFTIQPDAVVNCTGVVTINVSGNATINGALTSSSAINFRTGGDFLISGTPNGGADRGIFTSGSGGSINLFSDGALRVGNPADNTTKAFLRTPAGNIFVTGTDPAAVFEIGNGVIEASNGLVMVRSAGSVVLSGLQTRLIASVGAAVSEMRVQAYGGDVVVSGNSEIQANNFTGNLLVEASGSVLCGPVTSIRSIGGPSTRVSAFGGDVVLDGCEVGATGSGTVSLRASGDVEIASGASATSVAGPLLVIAFDGSVRIQPADSTATAELESNQGPILVSASDDVFFGSGSSVTSLSGDIDVDASGDISIVGEGNILFQTDDGDLEVVAGGSITADVELPEGPNAVARGEVVGFYADTGTLDLDDMEVQSTNGELRVVGQGDVDVHYRLEADGDLYVESANGNIDIEGSGFQTDDEIDGDTGFILIWCHLKDGTIDATNTTMRSGDAGENEGGGHSGGVSLLVSGDPLPPVASFILPKNINAKRNAADPSQSRLVASGFLDTGPDEVDLTDPATVDVGALFFEVPGFVSNAKGTKFTHAGDGLTLSISASKVGSSRAKFRLLAVGDFADAPALEEEITLRFANAAAEGFGIVDLDAGRYTLGKKRGALVEPNLCLYRAKATLNGEGNDVLSIKLGLATNGTTPGELPTVAVGFGEFEAFIPGQEFVKTGDKFTFKGNAGGVTTVILDFKKETILVQAKGVDLGEIPEGGSAVPIRFNLGGSERLVTVRMGRRGTAFIY